MTAYQLENIGFWWSEKAKEYFRAGRFMRYKFYQKRAVYYFGLARDKRFAD